tara:strand:+ start:509 stop:1042 length:534 start_codon:yes stop_codon:yes gene_type:complete
MEMLKDFNISSFKKMKPPSDNSFDTDQEIKALKKIPLRKDFVKKYDNIEKAFEQTAKDNNVKNYDKKTAAKLIKESAPVILELKKYHNRKRPYELDKNLKAVKMKSMNTPSYPSGHSAQGMLIASVLKDKYGKGSAFMKTAKNISDSRNVAHAHYISDSKNGNELGKQMYKHIKNKI